MMFLGNQRPLIRGLCPKLRTKELFCEILVLKLKARLFFFSGEVLRGDRIVNTLYEVCVYLEACTWSSWHSKLYHAQ